MEYFLMNTDIPVLSFDDEFTYMKVQNNVFLPYALKDYVLTTNPENGFKKCVEDIVILKDFLASRTLNLSRENAKTILSVAALPQSLKTTERIKITLACNGLNMEDNLWVKTKEDQRTFADVNLRKKHLAESSYDIAILGKHISATQESLIPDLMTKGMFAKYWHRNGDTIELWKTDKANGLNSKSEADASILIRDAGGNCIPYCNIKKDDHVFSVCNCMATEEVSLVNAVDVMDWCAHTGLSLESFLTPFEIDFANMVIADYVTGNTDRHKENWGFLVDNKTNRIKTFAPLYDLNQALIIDEFGNSDSLDDLIYEPCNITFKEAMLKYKNKSTLVFDKEKLTKPCRKRWDAVRHV